jgi:hypothetical protein
MPWLCRRIRRCTFRYRLNVKDNDGRSWKVVTWLCRVWPRILNGDGLPGNTCPVCGLPVKAQRTAQHPRGGLFVGSRPKGELEALCHQQNGTDHQVPIHW